MIPEVATTPPPDVVMKICESCKAEVPAETIAAAPDEMRLCPPCREASDADWAANRLVHVPPLKGPAPTCTWSGTVADLQAIDPEHDMGCPACGGELCPEDCDDVIAALELPEIARPPGFNFFPGGGELVRNANPITIHGLINRELATLERDLGALEAAARARGEEELDREEMEEDARG